MAKFDYVKSVSKYCTPAQLYLALAVIGILFEFMLSFNVVTLVVHGLFSAIFAFILNFLCKKGLTLLSWILVALPYVLAVLFYGLALDAKKANEKKEGMSCDKKRKKKESMYNM